MIDRKQAIEAAWFVVGEMEARWLEAAARGNGAAGKRVAREIVDAVLALDKPTDGEGRGDLRESLADAKRDADGWCVRATDAESRLRELVEFLDKWFGLNYPPDLFVLIEDARIALRGGAVLPRALTAEEQRRGLEIEEAD